MDQLIFYFCNDGISIGTWNIFQLDKLVMCDKIKVNSSHTNHQLRDIWNVSCFVVHDGIKICILKIFGNFSQYLQCYNLHHFILNSVMSVLICFLFLFFVLRFFRIGLSSSWIRYNCVKLESLPSPSPRSGNDCIAKKWKFDRMFKKNLPVIVFLFSMWLRNLLSDSSHYCETTERRWWGSLWALG